MSKNKSFKVVEKKNPNIITIKIEPRKHSIIAKSLQNYRSAIISNKPKEQGGATNEYSEYMTEYQEVVQESSQPCLMEINCESIKMESDPLKLSLANKLQSVYETFVSSSK